MYLRHSVGHKDGKTDRYWRLVRSVRRKGKVVQETVAQLGELDAQGRAKAKALARAIAGRSDEQHGLFEDVLLGNGSVAVLVIGRLCRPSSELYIAENWYRRTALEDLLGLPSDKVNDDRLYRGLDGLLPHKRSIEQHLVRRLGELFSLDYDLLLYDITSTYFEGEAQGNPLARRGYSRDRRPDCKQVCLALVVTRDGMPLGYEVFAGNRVDVTTVQEIVETMEARYGLAQRIWVMDRGMTSAENIAWLQETGRRYLIGTPRSELKKWSRSIAEAGDWKMVGDGVEVKLCPGANGNKTFLLCRSAVRREKERGMHELFMTRIEAGLHKLGRRIEGARKPLDRGALERQIGRLLERNPRAASRYDIRLVEEPGSCAKLRLEWSVRSQWDQWARYSQGCYVREPISPTGHRKRSGAPTCN